MEGLEVIITVAPLPLVLLRPFGTSHSTSTTRTNALVTATHGAHRGHGEAGLPPLKPSVYHSDYPLTALSVSSFVSHLAAVCGGPCLQPKRAWEVLKGWARGAGKEARPAANAIEMALVDLIAGVDGVPAHVVLGLEHPCDRSNGPVTSTKCGFVTVGIERDDAELVAAIEDALNYTDFLKLKADGGPDALAYLSRAMDHCAAAKKRRSSRFFKNTIAVDANCAWTPGLALEFLALRPGGDMVYMVEQPFGVDVEPGTAEWGQWEDIKRRYTEAGLLIYADESVATAEDVTHLQPLCHGVNVKLDKAGGFSGAIRAASVAREANMAVWFGCMISSSLACTAAAHLLSLATYGGDLDGGILTTKESQPLQGGMVWSRSSQGPSFIDIPCCSHDPNQPTPQGGIMASQQ